MRNIRVDFTHIPEALEGNEVIILRKQGEASIPLEEIAGMELTHCEKIVCWTGECPLYIKTDEKKVPNKLNNNLL